MDTLTPELEPEPTALPLGTLFEWETLRPPQWTEEELAEAEYLGHRPRHRDREWVLRFSQAAAERAQLEQRTAPAKKGRARSWLPWLAAAMALGLWPEQTGSMRFRPHLSVGQSSSEQERDTASLGDTGVSSPAEHEQDPSRNAVAEEFPKKPAPGQLKPDAKGRCPSNQIALNGGCWTKVALSPEECLGNGVMYQGSCHIPFYESSRLPASAPQVK